MYGNNTPVHKVGRRRQSLNPTEGNPPGQGLHDCATLENRFKCLALGLQLVDPQYKQNHAICLSMLPIADGTDETAAKQTNEVYQDIFGLDYTAVCNSTMSDGAALGVAGEFDQEGDKCTMHGMDKVSESLCGDLVRSKKKVEVEGGC